jgi:hypothetical protein
MPSSIAQQRNTDYIKSELMISRTTTSIVTTRNDHEIRQCLNQIPLPPRGYQFSEQQRDAHAQFFKDEQDQQLPDLRLDLYNASIIAMR